MKKIVFFALILLSFQVQSNELLATVDGEKITLTDLRNFANSASSLKTYLSIPNGSEKLLNLLIDQKLLIKEGKLRNIEPPKDIPSENDMLYAQWVRGKLTPACEPADEQELQQFYQDNPKLFSTPYYVRVKRLSRKAKTAEETEQAEQLIKEIRSKLEKNEMSFSKAVEQYSQDELSKARAGELGYLPISDERNPVFSQFINAKIGDFVGPIIEQTGLVNLYLISARREPILDSYEAVADILPEEYMKYCNKTNYSELIKSLKKKWPVEIVIETSSAKL